jgi:hypothetical protein
MHMRMTQVGYALVDEARRGKAEAAEGSAPRRYPYWAVIEARRREIT